ncbi:hypothetical protein [Maritalea sp.]|uniref:hypothetical protein n=1 Tax=Maritalea sp. TaxID=2003361 RepID=UPI003EF72812
MNIDPVEIQTHRLAQQIQMHPKDRATRAKFHQMPAEYRAKYTLPQSASGLSTTDSFAQMAKQTANAMGWN